MLDATTSVAGEVATVTLVGDADADSAPRLDGWIAAVTRTPVRRLVLDVTRVGYMSSAGLRCLVFAHQRLGRGVEIVLVGARPEVAETIRLTGFDRTVRLVDEAPS